MAAHTWIPPRNVLRTYSARKCHLNYDSTSTACVLRLSFCKIRVLKIFQYTCYLFFWDMLFLLENIRTHFCTELFYVENYGSTHILTAVGFTRIFCISTAFLLHTKVLCFDNCGFHTPMFYTQGCGVLIQDYLTHRL